jgi:hypothetical protein
VGYCSGWDAFPVRPTPKYAEFFRAARAAYCFDDGLECSGDVKFRERERESVYDASDAMLSSCAK